VDVLRLIALITALGIALVAWSPARADPAAPTESTAPAGAPSAPSAGDSAATSPRPTATMGAVDPDAPRLPARLDGGERVVLPPMVVPQDRAAVDRRPVFIGAGLIVLALTFWWNRRRRDRFEREDQGEPVRRRRDADADADDLHAAARGGEPDGETDGETDAEPQKSQRPDP
jgi:hypothetical protein